MLLTHFLFFCNFLRIFFVVKDIKLSTQEIGSHLSQVTIVTFCKFVLINGDHVITSCIQITFFASQHILVPV